MNDNCDITKRPPAPENNPTSEEILHMLKTTKTIAVVGLSKKTHRESYIVGKYLLDHGYIVIPVNPQFTEWEGIAAYPTLADIPKDVSVDMVDLFRRADAIDELVDEILALKPKVAWLQLGVVNNEAARKMRDGGVKVVQDKCVKIEHRDLVGD